MNNGFGNNGYNYNDGYNDPNSPGFGNSGFTEIYGQQQTPYYNQNTSTVSLSDFTRKVYGWMFLGLAITFGLAILIVTNPQAAMRFMTQHIGMYYVLALVEVALVFALGFFVTKLPPAAALAIFLTYSAINGLTIAPILLLYEMGTVIAALGVTGGIFGAMSLYGMITKRDLSGLGPVLIFGLIGLLIFSVISMIFHMPMSRSWHCWAHFRFILISSICSSIFSGFSLQETTDDKVSELPLMRRLFCYIFLFI